MSAAHKTKAPGMVSGFGKLHTNKEGATHRRAYVPITWEEICGMVDRPPSVAKSDARWFIPSTLLSREAKEQEARGEYWVLWAEFDGVEATAKAPPTIETVSDMLDLLVFREEVNREQHSSRSATADWQKSHLHVPLAKPLKGADWVICQQIFHESLVNCDLDPDPGALGASQICYLPNKGDYYETRSKRDGVMFDPLKEWAPQIAKKRAELARARQLLEERRERARERREAMRAARGVDDLTLVEAFNQAYTPADFMLAAGYDEHGDSFRHPASQSGSYSASIKEGADGVLRVHSLSSSDRLYTGGRGGGAHDAFSTFTVLNHGTDDDAKRRATIDAGDNWLKIGAESWNKFKRREHKQSESAAAAEDFEGEEIDPDTGEVRPKHPLARFINYEAEALAPEWVLPGFIGPGIVTIAGSAGVGKTSALLPLAMAAAGLHEAFYELAPKHWRHVIYITEDTAQARRLIAGMLGSSNLGLDRAAVLERLHIVEAMRLDVTKVAKVGKVYRDDFTRTVQGVELAPLVVIDTKAAVLESEDENSNSEASRIVNVLKQGFEHLPTWVVGHIAKQQVGRSDLASLSMRGGSAFEADANQCLYIIKDGDAPDAARYLVRGKTRFEAKWSELAIQSYTSTTTAKDQWGDEEEVTMRWAIASPGLRTRAQAKAAAQEDARAESEALTRDAILEAVTTAWLDKQPLNRGAVRTVIKRGAAITVSTIEKLLASGHLYEVHIPNGERLVKTRGTFLVSLTDAEREEFIRSGVVPESKLEVPPSWGKQGAKAQVDDVPGGNTSAIEKGSKT